MRSLQIRFYEELNDFLPKEKRKTQYGIVFNGHPGIKDLIEAEGIPHTEVDLILVNGDSVTFDYKVNDGDHVSVYPVFESFDIGPINRLRPETLRRLTFIADAHLGKLAKKMRLLGFDTLYDSHYQDREIARISNEEDRIVLTRDLGLLKRKAIQRGYYLRSTDTLTQLWEVIRRFQLQKQFNPFTICMLCNGKITATTKDSVIGIVGQRTFASETEFFRCDDCGQIYWKGSHYNKLINFISVYLTSLDSDCFQ